MVLSSQLMQVGVVAGATMCPNLAIGFTWSDLHIVQTLHPDAIHIKQTFTPDYNTDLGM